jgi:hypothetical protein
MLVKSIMIRRLCDRTRIRYHFAILLMLLGGISASAQVSITPSTPPALNSGQTFTFTASVAEGGGVTWSCPGCQGSIDPTTGVYTAPAIVHAQQSFGGYQLLPNDHIYNTRIDSLPVNGNSNSWIGGAGAVPVNYLPSFPLNYVDGSTPIENFVFQYTAGNNGPFQLLPPSTLRIESGWYTRTDLGQDHHAISIDTKNGTVQELYDPVPVGRLTSQGCPTCTAVSGIRYSNSTYNLPNSQGGGVDAAGLYITPLMLRLQELEQAVATGGTINHALRFTLQNGYIKFNSFIWPGTASSYAGGGVVPFGSRFRLKSSFNISGFSPIAQVLLTQLKQYGLILADGGYGWQINTEGTRWPASYLAAFNEIGGARIGPSNFEAVDESGLEVSPTSGLTTIAETVVATGINNPAHSASQQVVLTGVTITLPKDALNVQAGSAVQQLAAFIHGSSNAGINWTMSPTVGTLTSGGRYTPPPNISSASTTTVTATSAADPTAAASLTLTVLPAGTIRLVLGQPGPYTDTHGNVWLNGIGGDNCQPYDSGGSWPSTSDVTLYKIPCLAMGDNLFDFIVPNGTYAITAKFAEHGGCTPGGRLMNLEAQGQIIYANADICVSAGGANLPIDFTLPATVTNGLLSFVVRHVNSDFTIISALQIVPMSLSGTTPPGPPAPPSNMQIIVK